MAGGPRIMQVVASLAVGGAERVALELAAGMVARGITAELLCARPGGGAPPTEFERSVMREADGRGVRVHRMDFAGPRDRGARHRFAQLLEERETTLVHVHNRPTDWQVVAMCRLLGVPAIYTIHLPYPHTPRQRALYAVTAQAVPAIICVSRAVADHAKVSERVPESKLHVIYNGLEMSRFAPRPPLARIAKRAELKWEPDDFVWLCAARLNEQKGHVYLIDAMDRLPPTSRARLVLAGEGPLAEALEAQRQRMARPERVTFLGPRRDVPELLDACDGYACASIQEGHPLSLLEAMATGTPVVAPRLPSIVEIADGDTPYVYGPTLAGAAPSHDPAQIAEALYAVEKDALAHRTRAARGRARVVSAYSLGSMLDGHEALYRKLAAPRSRVGRALGRLLA